MNNFPIRRLTTSNLGSMMIFPVLFAAGMVLVDTMDGITALRNGYRNAAPKRAVARHGQSGAARR